MNRKNFIQSFGATCANWTWSWSFVNHEQKLVIFGAWDNNIIGEEELLLDTKWEFSKLTNRKQSGFSQALGHLKLIEKEGYSLSTFKLIFSDEYLDTNGLGPAKIKGFVNELLPKNLVRRGNQWFAIPILSQKKVARLCWNSERWTLPSGSDGKSKNPDTYEAKHGYGHEEWLLDISKIIDGYHYGFIQAFGNQRDSYLGQFYDVSLYTLNCTTKQRMWLGQIKSLQVVGADESRKVYEIYQNNGWYQQMQNQLNAVGGSTEAFNNVTHPEIFAVVKFKIDSLELLDEPLEFSRHDLAVTADYYNLKRFVKVPSFQNNGGKFEFQSGHRPKVETGKQNYSEHSGNRDMLHNKIQTKLYEYLVKIHGKNNVKTECPSGNGTYIDVVTRSSGKYTLYEIKVSLSTNRCVRDAIGQLLEYAHFGRHLPLYELVIVSPFPTNPLLNEYMQFLRDTYKLPISYKQFNQDTIRLE